MDWNILEKAYAVRVLLTVDEDPGRPKTAYMRYSNVRTVFNRLTELEEAGLLRSEKGDRYRSIHMYPTSLGHRLAEALRGAVDGHEDPEPTEDTSEAPKPWTGHACDDCGNARIGRHGETICEGHGPVDYPLVSVCEEWRPKKKVPVAPAEKDASAGRCVDCANYECDEDLGPCCRRDGAFRLVAFPYGPGCDRWRERP